MIHAFIEKAIFTEAFDLNSLTALIEPIIQEFSVGLAILNVPKETACSILKDCAQAFVGFSEKYIIGASPELKTKDGTQAKQLKNTFCRAATNKQPSASFGITTKQVQIERMLGYEDYIISPAFGLKGRLDGRVKAKIAQRPNQLNSQGAIQIPFEIKTGQRRSSYGAQVILYMFLLHDRFGINIVISSFFSALK